jgi:hypothetical protein
MTSFEVRQSSPGITSRSLNLAVDIDEGEVKRRLVQCMEVALDNARGLANA